MIYNIERQQQRGISVQAHISDIHFGVMDPKIQYDFLKTQFVDKIRGINLDCISIDGDLFDRLTMSNTDTILYASLFVKDLIDICRENQARGIHTVLVLLAGTRNHDAGQLRLFYQYLTDPSVDIRIVEDIGFENINGCRVLCIPELYNISNEVYWKYLYEQGQYDMVFGHGTIQGAVYDNGQNVARIFEPEDFAFCRGPVIFGHVHPGGSFHGFCYYNGSPLRWCFGEEEIKGFQMVIYNMDTAQYYIHKEPITSYRYDTISIDDLMMNDPNTIIQYIDNLKQTQGIDFIRIKCISNGFTQDKINVLKAYYAQNKAVKFQITKDSDLDKQQMDEKEQNLYNQYSYFFNKSMSPYEIFVQYVNQSQSDVIITVDQLMKILKD